MASSSFTRAIAYCEQALQSCQFALAWLQNAGVDAPLYLATINEISAAVVVIQAMVNNLVFILDNQESGNVLSPISTVTNISLTVMSVTNLYVVPAGKTFICTGFTVRPTSQLASNNDWNCDVIRLSDAAVVCPGDGAPATFPSVGGNLQFSPLQNQDYSPTTFASVLSGDTVQFRLNSIDSGTTNVVSVDLFGYLV